MQLCSELEYCTRELCKASVRFKWGEKAVTVMLCKNSIYWKSLAVKSSAVISLPVQRGISPSLIRDPVQTNICIWLMIPQPFAHTPFGLSLLPRANCQPTWAELKKNKKACPDSVSDTSAFGWRANQEQRQNRGALSRCLFEGRLQTVVI